MVYKNTKPSGKQLTVTVVVPVHNSATTLKSVLKSLEEQSYPIEEVFILDNNSSDQSPEIIREFVNNTKLLSHVITHNTDCGLAYSYNEAINKSSSELVVTLQSDCVIRDTEDLNKLITPFVNDIKIVASCSLQVTPRKTWLGYNFWQKALFSRHVGRIASGRNGRFCAFRTKTLRKIGAFDCQAYRTAGEDGDIFFKLQEQGLVVDASEVIVDHLHSINPGFRLVDYLYKENQLAEGGGACFRNNLKRAKITNYLTPLLRPIMIVGCFIPYLNYLIIPLVVVYAFWLTKELFLNQFTNPRILILPWVNLWLLVSFSFYFLKGFITKRQRL